MTACWRRCRRVAGGLALAAAAVLAPGPVAAEDAPAPVAGVKHVDAALQRRIDDAVEGATRWLLANVREDGSYPPNAVLRGNVGQIGLAALAGYAMRHGGVERADPRMARVREYVRRGVAAHVPEAPDALADLDVYSAGLSIAFLLETGVPTDDPALVRTVRRLEQAWCETGWWTYGLGMPTRRGTARSGAAWLTEGWTGGGNVSTTLYAMIGLHAAARHGIAVDTGGLDRYMDALGERQMRDGGFLYADALPSQTVGGRSYFGAASNAVAAYLLAGDATGRLATPADALRRPIVQKALPYLEEHFGPDVWGKPPAPPRQSTPGGAVVYRMTDGVPPLCAEDTYNLYATERIGMLLGAEAIGKVRWYESGALWLVGTQRRDGSWAPADALDFPQAATTAFGLLFLARSVRPVGTATTPADDGAVTGPAPEAFDFSGAPDLARIDWYDLFHRALVRFQALDGEARARAAPRFALLGPRVVRALVFELESDDRDRRSAARDVLVAVAHDDAGFDPDGDAKARARGIAAWRRWLAALEPYLVLEDGALVAKPAAEAPRGK